MRIIALRTVKYNDTHSILSAYAAERGRVSLLVPAGASKSARRTRALLMPLSVVECEATFRPGREMAPVREVKPLLTAVNTSSEPHRAMTALFLADCLNAMLREVPADDSLFEYLRLVATMVEEAPSSWLPNLHLIALARLSHHFGVAPDTGTYRRGSYLDMIEGVWRITPPIHQHYLTPQASHLAKILVNADFSLSPHLRLKRAERNLVLDAIIDYYTLHFKKFALPSLEILRMF